MFRNRNPKEGACPPSVLVALLLILTAAESAAATHIRVHVIGVTDGDTINVTDAHHHLRRIRIAAIDAPEMEQPFGADSKRHLRRILLRHDVELVVYTRDNYGRDVASVIDDGRDIGLAQIRAGLAWHYAAYDNDRSEAERAAYDDAQTSAREAHRGLWKQRKPVAPWEFRQSRKAPE